jgi:hypothetical protein
MHQVIRLQHKALATEEGYVHRLRRFMKAMRQRTPPLSSEKKLEKFLTNLAVEQDVSASTQNQAFNPLASILLGSPRQATLRARQFAPLKKARANLLGRPLPQSLLNSA